jgi:hypothetical protein
MVPYISHGRPSNYAWPVKPRRHEARRAVADDLSIDAQAVALVGREMQLRRPGHGGPGQPSGVSAYLFSQVYRPSCMRPVNTLPPAFTSSIPCFQPSFTGLSPSEPVP